MRRRSDLCVAKYWPRGGLSEAFDSVSGSHKHRANDPPVDFRCDCSQNMGTRTQDIKQTSKLGNTAVSSGYIIATRLSMHICAGLVGYPLWSKTFTVCEFVLLRLFLPVKLRNEALATWPHQPSLYISGMVVRYTPTSWTQRTIPW